MNGTRRGPRNAVVTGSIYPSTPVQDEITAAIVENLKVKLLAGETAALRKRPTEDPEANKLYLKGRYFYAPPSPPSAALFPGLAKVASLVSELSPDKWAYINLFPDYASNTQLRTTNYTEYLEKFVAMCRPSIISYDNYSLMDDGSVRESYWLNLEAVRAASRRHGIEFWNIVLAVAHFSYRELGAADFRFQVYTTLAYGGRRISILPTSPPRLAITGWRQSTSSAIPHQTGILYRT